MKVLIQNRIDGFTEVQLSALAAFQSEQADGGLSKNLRGKEKRKSKVLLGIVQLQLLGMMHIFGHFSLISTCFCVRSCFLSKCDSKEKNVHPPKQHTELKDTGFISGFVIRV